MANEKCFWIVLFLQFTITFTVLARKDDIFSGYKGLTWGSSVEYVKTNYTATLEPCELVIEARVVNNGEYCLIDETPGKFIKKRTFHFFNGKLFMVVIDFSNEGLANMQTVKDSFFTDFGPTRIKRDTTMVPLNVSSAFKMKKYSESYTWKNRNASIILQKDSTKISDKTKADFKNAVKPILETQIEVYDSARVNKFTFLPFFETVEVIELKAIFLSKKIVAEAGYYDKY